MKKAVQFCRCKKKNVGWADSSGGKKLAIQPEGQEFEPKEPTFKK